MRPNAVLAPEFSVIYIDQSHVFVETGQTWSAQYQADDPEQPMKLMLVWTDAPGHGNGGSTPAWNNDLDLRVSVGEDVYLGNVLADGWSATGGSADGRNNTEGVFLQPEQHGGTISVEVLAANINSNALPNAGDDNAQDFALVCYNCVEAVGSQADLALSLSDVPDPVLPGAPLTYVIPVANFGPDAAVDTTLTVMLPAEFIYSAARSVPAGSGDWPCAHDRGTVTCVLPDPLPAPAIAPVLEIDTAVAPDADPGIVTATARVDSAAGDPSSDNNQASEETEILVSPDRLFRDGFECIQDTPECAKPGPV